jgi:ribonuclease HI
LEKVIIYTDGASQGNPGPGGYGIVLISGARRKEISKGFRHTTNNRMELMSVIEALKALKKNNLDITVYSDSRYVVDAVNLGWVFNWQRKGFNKKKNSDLWQKFLQVYAIHRPKFKWIKGHNANPENERCDELAVRASHSEPLETDKGYEIDLKDNSEE